VTERNTTTETALSTYTITTTLPQGTNTAAFPQGLSVMLCILTEYEVLAMEFISNSSTSMGNSTQSYDVQTYETTSSVIQTVGFETTSPIPITYATNTTLSGPLITSWDISICTAISSG
jgi:hypothetical protein